MAAFRFSALNKRVQLAIALGIPTVIALGLALVTYQKLGELGPDPSLPGFLRRESVTDNKWEQINALQADIDKQDGIIRLRPIRQRELDSLSADIETASKRLPREKDVLDIVQKLSQLAREIPSDIGAVKMGPISYRDASVATARGAPGGGAAQELPQIVFDTEIVGDINGIIKFIDLIEKDPRFMSVTKIAIKPGKIAVDKEAQAVRMEPHRVSLTLVTYTYVPSQTAGGK
jgi:hypothetical protein